LPALSFSLSIHPGRDPSSSPTRRASDLAGSPFLSRSLHASSMSLATVMAFSPAHWTSGCPVLPALTTSTSGRHSATRSWASGNRSEEHTSALQSRENLVCRLLLEKNKTE